jgi:tRNA threonylcarbamoyladenosine biosynthesis protein TsaB
MIVLGFELSSAQCSLALLEDDTVLVERQWEQSRATGQRLFQAWPDALREAGLSVQDIDLFVCGRGPGSFSGVRISLAAAQAAALPGDRPVVAVSSGQAVARSVAGQGTAGKIAVVGDARRDTIWLGEFAGDADGVRPTGAWELVTPDAFATRIAPGTTCVTSQWDRLQALLGRHHPQTVSWIEGDRYPPAREIARAGLRRHRDGPTGSEPLSPLYLHPAVRI